MTEEKVLSVERNAAALVAAFLVDSIYEDNWNQFEGELLELVEEAGSVRLVLDMSGLAFLSSFALGIIISAVKKAEEQGGRLLFAGIVEPVAKVFEVASLSKKFHIYESVDEALTAQI